MAELGTSGGTRGAKTKGTAVKTSSGLVPGTAGELVDQPATVQLAMMRTRQVSARELLEAHLARIEARNPELNAVVGLDADVAMKRAAAVDEAVAGGRLVGPLAGLVTAHKDLIDTADFVTTQGAKPYADHRPTVDSLIVERMKRAGAVAVGKTNVPEFGAGSHTFNPVYGATGNAYDSTRSAGGSSGGAAVALATGMVAVADGSDVGGSLRNPAAWNNVVGFRPSVGVVPSGGAGNAWHPLPIHGPMARTVDDVVLLLAVMARPDTRDPLGRGLKVPAPEHLHPPTQPLRVAWSRDLGGLPMEAEIVTAMDGLRATLENLDWMVVDDEPDFTGTDEVFLTLRAFMYAEKSDELRPHLDDVKATVRGEIERGLALTGPEVSAAFTQLKDLWDRAHRFFQHYDLLVGPVTQVMPFPLDWEYPTEVSGVAMGSYVEWMRSCSRITSFGLPALSLPIGFGSSGLPVGAQLVGRPFGDLDLLLAAKAVESTHDRR